MKRIVAAMNAALAFGLRNGSSYGTDPLQGARLAKWNDLVAQHTGDDPRDEAVNVLKEIRNTIECGGEYCINSLHYTDMCVALNKLEREEK